MIRVGTRVEVLVGRYQEHRGRVSRINPSTGWLHVRLDCFRKDPSYRSIEFGPFTHKEVKLLKRKGPSHEETTQLELPTTVEG